MLSGKLLRLVTAHLAGRDAAGLLITIDPVDRGADPDAEAGRRLPPRQTLLLHRRNHPLAKIHRIRSRHPCWPPSPASMVNHISLTMGIVRRLGLSSSRSRSNYCSVGFVDREGGTSQPRTDTAIAADT